jgi:hypothetical protein
VEKLIQIERQVFEERMKVTYQGLAEENLHISEDFKFSDAENLPEVGHTDSRQLQKSLPGSGRS